MRKLFVIAFSLLTLALPARTLDSQWKGCRIAVLGDSISDPGLAEARGWCSWWKRMEDILGVKSYSFAVNGYQMNGLLSQAERMKSELGDGIDAVFIFCGTNDFNADVPIGDWYTEEYSKVNKNGRQVMLKHREPVFSDATFRGRINIVLDWLKTNYPDKQIVLLTPIHRGFARFSDNNVQPEELYSNTLGLFIDDYVQVVKDAGNIWSVPVIDINGLSGLMPRYDSFVKYFENGTDDRLHPSDPGHERLAYTISYQLLALPSGVNGD